MLPNHNFSFYLNKIKDGSNLTQLEAELVFKQVILGLVSEEEIKELLISLKNKKESISEIIGATNAIISHAKIVSLPDDVMDVCGTGGDNSSSLNISTAVSLVVAACGVKVAKHGNRSVSSKSGSSDVLEHLGVKIDCSDDLTIRAVNEINLGFFMAPVYHPILKNLAKIRKDLATRTIFNLLGPLCNPARVKYQLMGVYDKELLLPIANVLQELGSIRAWVVHGEDGLDEITVTGKTYVAELNNGHISQFAINPVDYGMVLYRKDQLQGGDVRYNADQLKILLSSPNNNPAYRDIVIINSAACLVIAGKAKNLSEAISMAQNSLESGKANAILNKLVNYCS